MRNNIPLHPTLNVKLTGSPQPVWLVESAAEFARLTVGIIGTEGTPYATPAMQATSIIVDVAASAGGPVGTGLIASVVLSQVIRDRLLSGGVIQTETAF